MMHWTGELLCGDEEFPREDEAVALTEVAIIPREDIPDSGVAAVLPNVNNN